MPVPGCSDADLWMVLCMSWMFWCRSWIWRRSLMFLCRSLMFWYMPLKFWCRSLMFWYRNWMFWCRSWTFCAGPSMLWFKSLMFCCRYWMFWCRPYAGLGCFLSYPWMFWWRSFFLVKVFDVLIRHEKSRNPSTDIFFGNLRKIVCVFSHLLVCVKLIIERIFHFSTQQLVSPPEFSLLVVLTH